VIGVADEGKNQTVIDGEYDDIAVWKAAVYECHYQCPGVDGETLHPHGASVGVTVGMLGKAVTIEAGSNVIGTKTTVDGIFECGIDFGQV